MLNFKILKGVIDEVIVQTYDNIVFWLINKTQRLNAHLKSSHFNI